jgi:multiple sugar transport system permease protein
VRKRRLKTLREVFIGYSFCLPAYIIFAIFIFIPIIWAFVLSFSDYNILTLEAPHFVGVHNYVKLVKDSVFLISLRNTALYTLIYVPISLFLGFIFALLLNDDFPGRNFFRMAIFVPSVISLVVESIIWLLILSAQPSGLMNRIISVFGIPPQGWLSDPKLALISVAVFMIWRSFGYNMLLYLAAMQSIPAELYEVAELDGAKSWQKTFYVTLPMLKPTTFFLTVTSIISSFQIFTPIYIMTGGGPGYSTTTIVNYLYQKGFQEFEMGYASAISYVLFVILIILTVIQKKGFRAEKVAL